MSEPRNILIIRLSAIGDVVMASPLIGALRRRYPEARISWLVEPAAKGLLVHHPELDEVIVLPRPHWRELWRARRWRELGRELAQCASALRARRFDLVLDTQGLMKSAVWARATGARRRIGLGSKEGSQWLMTEVVSRQVSSRRIGAEYHHLATHLGLALGDFAMELALSDKDRGLAAELAKPGRYAVICPFTTRPQKHWIESRWPVLAEAIMGRLGLPVVMLGGPADGEAAARLMAQSPSMINLVGKYSLAQSAAVIEQSALLIGVDTGLTHMGIAFDVPTVALFGSTCPYQDTTRDSATVIYHRFDCSPCRRRPSCEGRFDCMAAIEVDEVVLAAQQMIDVRARR